MVKYCFGISMKLHSGHSLQCHTVGKSGKVCPAPDGPHGQQDLPGSEPSSLNCRRIHDDKGNPREREHFNWDTDCVTNSDQVCFLLLYSMATQRHNMLTPCTMYNVQCTCICILISLYKILYEARQGT